MTDKERIPKLRFPGFTEPWVEKKLGDVFKPIRNGFVGIATPYYVENENLGVKYLYGKNVKSGKLMLDDLTFISHEFNNKHTKSQLKENDIIMVQSGHVGESAVVPQELNGSNCHALIIITPNTEVNSFFVSEYFNSEAGKIRLFNITTGNTIKHILASEMKKFSLHFPTLPEQQKIANFLSDIDTKIEKLSRKKELMSEYKKGVMQKIFSQKIRFKDENGNDYPDWEEKRLGEVFKITAGGDIKKDHVSEKKTDLFKYPIYANSDKQKGLYGYSDLYKIDFDCITVTGRGSLGIAVARNHKFYPIVRLLILKPKQKADIFYFENYINHMNFFVESTGVPQLTGPQISIYKINLPCYEEQKKIAELLTNLVKKTENIDIELNSVKEFKKGLLQKMFV